MKKLNQKQLSQVLNISSQAVGGLTTRGRLIRGEDGLYNLSDPENRSYLKEKNINIKKIQIPETGTPGRPVAPRKQGEISPAHDTRSQSELQKEFTQKKIRKLDLEHEIKLKKYLPTEYVENFLIRYIEVLNSNIERSAATSIRDYGKEILNSGEVTSDLINRWTNIFLSLCHKTKLQILEEIKNYNPETGTST